MNDAKAVAPLRECSKCKEERVPEGGVAMGGGKWYCASCYRKFFFRR